MTQREQDILKASVSWTDKVLTVNEEKAFQAGAKWADKTNALELFKKLPHLNNNKNVVVDWGCVPNLYFFAQFWHVSWIHCEEGGTLIDFEAGTPEEAIKKAFDWCVELKLIEK